MNQKNEILWTIFKESELTQKEFATRVGMDRANNISIWLSGHQEISYKKLEHISECFGYKLKVELINKF